MAPPIWSRSDTQNYEQLKVTELKNKTNQVVDFLLFLHSPGHAGDGHDVLAGGSARQVGPVAGRVERRMAVLAGEYNRRLEQIKSLIFKSSSSAWLQDQG